MWFLAGAYLPCSLALPGTHEEAGAGDLLLTILPVPTRLQAWPLPSYTQSSPSLGFISAQLMKFNVSSHWPFIAKESGDLGKQSSEKGIAQCNSPSSGLH